MIMIRLTGEQIMREYEVESRLDTDVEYRLIKVDEEEGAEKLFDSAGYEYEYRPDTTYRVDSCDGIITVQYVYDTK